MPQIIVTAGPEHGSDEGTVMLRERVNATDFESDRFTTNLLERLGWAVEDATAAEQQDLPIDRGTPAPPRPHRAEQPDRDPEPAGIA